MIENLDQNQIIFIITAMAGSAVVTGFMAGFFGIGARLNNGSYSFLLI